MELNKQKDFTAIRQKKWPQSQFFKIFCYIMLSGFCLFFLSLLLLGLDRWKYLFYLHVNPIDYFMDYFNPLSRVQLKDIYSIYKADYPALSYLILNPFSQIIPVDILHATIGITRKHICCILSFLSFFGISIAALTALMFKNIIGTVKEKLLFCFLIIFSGPFLYELERGNIIIVALIFTAFFIFYYDSPKRYLREISLFLLACAIAMKIYPAAVGILLLKDKRYKDILRLGVYTVCLFILPFFYYNGILDIKKFLENISFNSKYYLSQGYGNTVNIYNTSRMIVYALTKQEYVSLNTVFGYISYFALFTGGVISFFINKKWKTVAMACLLMILVPIISWKYTLIFMIPPLILFLNDEENKSFKELIYLILFCLIFMLNILIEIPIFMPKSISVGMNPVLLDNFCARFACLVMFIMLCFDGIKDFKIRTHRNKSL